MIAVFTESQTTQIVVESLRSWSKSCQNTSRSPTHGKHWFLGLGFNSALFRVALLGSASSGKSTLCGVLTQGGLDSGHGSSRLNFLRYLHEIRSGKTSSITVDCFGFTENGEVCIFCNKHLLNASCLDSELQGKRLERHFGAFCKIDHAN